MILERERKKIILNFYCSISDLFSKPQTVVKLEIKVQFYEYKNDFQNENDFRILYVINPHLHFQIEFSFLFFFKRNYWYNKLANDWTILCFT